MKKNLYSATARKSLQNHHLTASSPTSGGRLRRLPMERMMLIHELITSEKFPNCIDMSAQMEVSSKTLKRDLQFMRVHWNLPLEYDRRRHGFFYSARVDMFPGAPAVTEAEMFALLVAHKAIAQYHGTPFHQPLQKAFQKLTA